MLWTITESVHVEMYVTCSLLAGVNCVANKSKFDYMYNPNLPEWKTRSFILILVRSPERWKSLIRAVQF